jgi:hypothetical protein
LKKNNPFSPQLASALEAGINNVHSKWSKSPGGDHRSDFFNYISDTLHLRPEYARDLVERIFGIIADEVVGGGRFVFPNVGAISTKKNRYHDRVNPVHGVMLKNRVGRFTFHHTFMSKLTGKTNHNEKHNWLRMERYRAWRDMYKPENSAAAYEKAISDAEKNGVRRTSCGEAIRAKSKSKRLRKLGSGIVAGDKKEI